MKRYLLFAGGDSPLGGWRDVIGVYDTPEEAGEALDAHKGPSGWVQLIDLFYVMSIPDKLDS